MTARRCILLFSRGASAEARAKGLSSPSLFDLARRRIERIAKVTGVALLVPSVQRGTTFGERLENAFRDAASEYDEIVVVPIDVPQLAACDVTRAFNLLAEHDVVLGPSDDGGVYLIAGRAAAADRFANVRWLTPHVFDDLRRGDTAVLSLLPDIDCADDLEHLFGSVPSVVLIGIQFTPPPAPRSREAAVASIALRGPPAP